MHAFMLIQARMPISYREVVIELELNWTIGSFVGLVSVAITIMPFLLTLYSFLNERNRNVSLIVGTYFGLTLWSLFMLLGNVLLSELMALLGLYCGALTLIIFYLLVDSFTRDEIDPRKLVVLSALVTALLIVSLESDSIFVDIHPFGEPFVSFSPRIMAVGGALILLTAITYSYYAVMMHRQAPANLKKFSRLGLLSAFILVVVWPVSVTINLNNFLPGVWLLILEVGVVPIGIAFVKEAKLGYILPFMVLRLAVFETEGGVPLYTHSWDSTGELAHEALFSGMQGIGMILDESVKRGEVREIDLESAILIIRRSEKFPVACALLATKSTKTLRHALDIFTERFFAEFSQFLGDTSEVFRFAEASRLVEDCFGFVPTIYGSQ